MDPEIIAWSGLFIAVWLASGYIGVTLANQLWFSVELQNLRKYYLQAIDYVVIVLFGPFAVFGALILFAVGIGRKRHDHD